MHSSVFKYVDTPRRIWSSIPPWIVKTTSPFSDGGFAKKRQESLCIHPYSNV